MPSAVISGPPLAPAEAEPEAGGLRSVSIAASALECFARHPELGATALARELGVAKSTACRMLAALAAGGLLVRAPGGRYRLGLRLFELGLLAAERLPIRELARPVLQELQTQVRQMVQLGVPLGGHVLYVDRYGNAGLGSRLSGEIVRKVPGYSSSSGRALAAFDATVRRDTLALPRTKHTPFTIVDADRLGQVLAAARQAGWVSSREEFEPGYSSVAAPVLVSDLAVAAISVVGPTPHILGAHKDFIVACTCRATRRLGQLLAASAED